MVDEKIAPYVFGPTFFVAFAVYDWYLWITRTIPNPLFLTAIAVAVVIFSAVKVSKLQKEIRSLKQGRDGERVVGHLLDTLHTNDCFVLHDIVGEGFNVDHLVVSEGEFNL